MSKKIVYLIFLILISNIAAAATIHGTIYSFELEQRNNTIVSIDSVPSQKIVSKDGEYSFELLPGKYEITASYYEGKTLTESALERIEIQKEGNYNLDLILFPSFGDEEILLNETEENVFDESSAKGISIVNIIISAIAVMGLGFVAYLIFRYKKQLSEVHKEVKKTAEAVKLKDMDKGSKEVIDFIQKQGGRVTQKDIRKNFPSSEAKISLIISELEEKGILQKIKKGRGNIIILK